MNILFEDDSIIVIHKEAGIAVQSANVSARDYVSIIKSHLKAQNPSIKGEPYVGIIHRLDQPVEGIVVFAKNEKAAAVLSSQVTSDVMNKNYLALVEGIVDSEGTVEICNTMYKDPKEKKSFIIDANGKEDCAGVMSEGKSSVVKKLPQGVKLQKAVLFYSVEISDTRRDMSLLKISLKTGRFHQIRAQLSALGHPIVGDRKYGSSREINGIFEDGKIFPKGAIALCASELIFTHPFTDERLEFRIDGWKV